MYDSILVPTDGSEHAVRAAEHAAAIARAFEAEIHVVNVVDIQAAGGPFSAGGVDDEFVARLEAEGEDALVDVRDALDERGVQTVVTDVIEGKATEQILNYADEQDVDAIAMGTHGRTGIEHFVTGSVTEHVVRFADVPVLTARATDGSRLADGYEEVLVPTDGSKYAGVAFDHGIAVAQAFGARVHAVNVVNVSDLAADPGAAPTDGVIEAFEQAGERATEGVASAASDAGLEAVTAVRRGTPARALLDYAEEQDIDLLAMGTAGRTGPSRYLLGSTSERVIRHSDVPVLAVNARETE